MVVPHNREKTLPREREKDRRSELPLLRRHQELCPERRKKKLSRSFQFRQKIKKRERKREKRHQKRVFV